MHMIVDVFISLRALFRCAYGFCPMVELCASLLKTYGANRPTQALQISFFLSDHSNSFDYVRYSRRGKRIF